MRGGRKYFASLRRPKAAGTSGTTASETSAGKERNRFPVFRKYTIGTDISFTLVHVLIAFVIR